MPHTHHKTPKPYAKADVKAYPVLKTIEHYSRWYDTTIAIARAHGLEDVFDKDYVPDPTNFDEVLDFWYKQTFVFSVFMNGVKPNELRQYVEDEKDTSDAQRVIINMNRHVKQSTFAVLTTVDMMAEIATTKYDQRTWNKTSLEFVLGFNKLMDQYNDLQRVPAMRINDIMRRTYMQQTLRNHKGFQKISH